jgi:hypothetical protein
MIIGDLIQKLETKLFPDNPTSELEKLCKKREESLKEYIEICRIIIMQNIEKPGLNPENLSYWKKEKIKKNIVNLIKYTEELAVELDKSKIQEYCLRINTQSLFKSPFTPDFVFLIQNSYYSSVVTDILWASDITINEAMAISAGKLELNELGKKLPRLINETRKTYLPFIVKNKRYKRHGSTLEESLKCYNKKYYKACNLLLITAIEGLVRDLAEYLNKKQNLNLNLNTNKFNSIDTLLRNANWKDDFEISIGSLSMITGQDKTLKEEFEDSIKNPLDKTQVNLKTRLDFLRRRFKDDRNLIIHGLQDDYGCGWNLFLNFSALSHVYTVLNYYEDFYSK